MTPLVDVIFLLLLFFMLTSTFTKFAEVELFTTSGTAANDAPPLFLQLGPDSLRVNGEPAALDALTALPNLTNAEEGTTVLVSLTGGVDAQRLTDLLVALRPLTALRVTVLGS